MIDGILIHFGEIALKGGNRASFEKRLAANVGEAVRGLGLRRPQRAEACLLLRLPPGTDVGPVLEAIRPLPGIVWFAPVVVVPRDLDAAVEAVRRLARETGGTGPFKVDARRADKTFPLDSVALNRVLGAAIQEETGRPVDLRRPETVFGVRVTRTGIHLHGARHEGVGGLPVGASGRLLALVSGGIDSPVAAWRMMRRGVRCTLVHFLNRTVGDAAALEKVEELAAVLARTQGRVSVAVVPFGELQREIVANVPPEWRMIVYRRTMLRVAERLLPRFRALGFVTGDSVSQVASQTLENLRVIYAAARHPVYAPLAGDDKTEIVALARRIGTFDISSRPHTDCCSFLVAPHPCTRARLEDVEGFEAGCRLEPLVEAAADAVEVRAFASGAGR